jgi:hypothetical protein
MNKISIKVAAKYCIKSLKNIIPLLVSICDKKYTNCHKNICENITKYIEVYASFNVSEPLQKITNVNFKSDAAPALKRTAC